MTLLKLWSLFDSRGLMSSRSNIYAKDDALTYSPSETFWKQLELYHASNGKVSLKDRSTRKFYMERTTTRFMSESSIADLEFGSWQMETAVLHPWTRWPSTPLLPPPAILPPHQVVTVDERFDARCAGM